jgi:hypothetical protein
MSKNMFVESSPPKRLDIFDTLKLSEKNEKVEQTSSNKKSSKKSNNSITFKDPEHMENVPLMPIQETSEHVRSSKSGMGHLNLPHRHHHQRSKSPMVFKIAHKIKKYTQGKLRKTQSESLIIDSKNANENKKLPTPIKHEQKHEASIKDEHLEVVTAYSRDTSIIKTEPIISLPSPGLLKSQLDLKLKDSSTNVSSDNEYKTSK